MGYRNLRQCVNDLLATKRMVRIDAPIDPRLEAAEIQRRAFRAGAPALYFSNVVGCRFPMVCNLFGSMERVRYIFRDSLDRLSRLVSLQMDPSDALRRPKLYMRIPWFALNARPKSVRGGPVLDCETSLDQLPQLVSWPNDGGPYITLPQVYTEDPDEPGFARANLGMYRVQLAGGEYEPNAECGMHYQLHRGIAAHHAAALRRGERLRVNVFVGGPPAMTVAAVMPLPEGLSELSFAGLLGRRRVRMIERDDMLPVAAEADFCIAGYLEPNCVKQEGPFGDHLGYYSMRHPFPTMRVERVYHRKDAIWPFTVVGRPPQEDTIFGQFVHELVGPILPKAVPGVKAVHAVDAAGVHPLLLAIGAERYAPYEKERKPRELLASANALLGHGQMSLAKYLWIAAAEDDPNLSVFDVPHFMRHVLERIDWRRDLHFQTRTTVDTLDYSGRGLHEGSKLVVAAAGPKRRELPTTVEGAFSLPESLGFRNPSVALPGVLVVEGPAYSAQVNAKNALGKDDAVARFCEALDRNHPINRFPLVVIVDHSDFAAKNVENFLWTTFTKSDPAADVYGVESFVEEKHWGCLGTLVIDARAKPRHAPELIEDPAITRRVDALAAPGGPLHSIL